MRSIEMALLAALATGAAIGITIIGPAVLAQQPAGCEPTQFFGAEGGILDGASGEQAIQVRACAEGTVWLSQDPTRSQSIGNLSPGNGPRKFSVVVDVRPCSLPDGTGSDLPGATLIVSLVSLTPEAKAHTVLTLAPDKESPTLNTTSAPRKGTKVKPGDTIKIRMDASEEYTYPRRYNWQTGVKKIQLIDESSNSIVTPHWEGTQMRACAAKQWKQFLEVTYTVPPNPPPIIRLRAIAEDFAGNRDEDVAEFPTVDLITGTYEWVGDTVHEDNLAGLIKNYSRHAATITLVPQSDGTLKGSAQLSFVMISSQRMPTGCLATDVRGDVMTWIVDFTGEARRQPDGSLKITMPISSAQPTYRYPWRNECDSASGENSSPVPPWPWTEVTLKNGVFDFESSPPLGPGEFGAPGRGSGLRMHLEQKPPRAPR